MSSASSDTRSAGVGVLSARCPNCHSDVAEATLELPGSPVMVCSAFPSAEEARAVAKGDIVLGTCTSCGFLFNTKFDQALALAGAQYESSQSASPHFTAFARALATDWVERYQLHGKPIIEVGCGQGEFLVEMIKAGAASGTGIDPLFDAAFIPDDMRGVIRSDPRDFAAYHRDLDAAALVCRHALEHIGDVSGFLELVAEWAAAHPGAPILLEVPGTERILAEGAFWDVFYEHCNYFTAATLEDAFLRAGMTVRRCELVYHGQYLILEALGLGEKRTRTPAGDVVGALDRSRDFGRKIEAASTACRKAMLEMADTGHKPIVLWQGASKTVSLSSLLGAGMPIDFAVDLNTRRHGQFLPPFGLEVRSPAALTAVRPKHVVLMNAVYMNEVRAELDRLGLVATELHSINNLLMA